MIERLGATIASLCEPSPSGVDARRLAECADALRLALDCPQQELTRRQRSALQALADRIEDADRHGAIADAARAAAAELGISRTTPLVSPRDEPHDPRP